MQSINWFNSSVRIGEWLHEEIYQTSIILVLSLDWHRLIHLASMAAGVWALGTLEVISPRDLNPRKDRSRYQTLDTRHQTLIVRYQ